MARLSRAAALAIPDASNNPQAAALRELLALFASATNQDASTWTMPVTNPDGSSIAGGSFALGAPVIVPGAQMALAVTNTAAAVTTLTIPATATYAIITADPTNGGYIRYAWEAVTLDATHGHVLAPGDSIEVSNISVLRLWSEAAGGLVDVTYEHY